MKSLKKLSIFLIILMIFTISSNVSAATPNSFVLKKEGTVYNPVDSSVAYFGYKYTEESNFVVLCTGQRDEDNHPDATYTKNNEGWDDNIRAGVARIIKDGVGEDAKKDVGFGSSTSPRLYITQISVWKYLEDKHVVSNEKLDTAIPTLNGASYYPKVSSLVASAEESEKALTSQITLSTSRLNFTIKGENYESDRIYIEKNGFETFTVRAVADNGATTYVEGDADSGYKVIVPASGLDSGTTTTITLTITASRNILLASNYSTEQGGQTLTPATLDTEPHEDTKTLSGSISVSNVPLTLKIKKVDNGGSILGDARFRIIKKDSSGNEVVSLLQWYKSSEEYRYDEDGNRVRVACRDSDGGLESDGFCDINLTGYGEGEWCIEEAIAPPGYKKNTRSVCGDLNSTNPTLELTMQNSMNSLTIKKIAKKGDSYALLSGSHLVIKDSSGNIAETIDGVKLDWISTDKAYKISGLPKGKYTIEEVEAPNGYSIAKAISFEIKEDGTIISDNLESKAGLFDKSATTILVYNDAEIVEVPNTGVKNILFIVFGCIFLIGGAGLIVYGIYKNKKLTV